MKNSITKQNIMTALIVTVGYMGIYLIGRVIWCDLSEGSLLDWLFTDIPHGEHSYLYGWLLSSNMFLYAMVISIFPAFFGKQRFSYVTFIGFIIGLAAGIVFGPYPEGADIGHDHYGWAIWCVTYLVSIVSGSIIELYKKKSV